MTDTFVYSLDRGCEGLGILLTDIQKEQLFYFYNAVVEKNKSLNLTAITQEQEFISKHIIDSLSIINTQSFKDCAEKESKLRYLDLGTGAGIPGVVLKIAFPFLEAVFSDSLLKRLTFIDEVISSLSLSDACTLHGRAEDLGHNPLYREKFDLVTARAVAELRVLSEYAMPFVKINGSFYAYKSGDILEEAAASQRALRLLGGKELPIQFFTLPATDLRRSIVEVKKVKITDIKYPRKAGTPSKNPL